MKIKMRFVPMMMAAVLALSSCTSNAVESGTAEPDSISVAANSNAVSSPSIAEEPTRPTFTNVLDEARYLQTLSGDEAWSMYGDYIYDLDPSEYSSVAEVYANENQIPFSLVGTVDTVEIPQWYSNFVDYEVDNFAFWAEIPWKDPADNWPYISLEDYIDIETEYLFYSVNREIEHISVFFDNHGDPNRPPEYYSYGMMTPDYPRRSSYYDELDEYYRALDEYERALEAASSVAEGGEIPPVPAPPPDEPFPPLHMCLCNPDSIRVIFSSTYTPNTIFLYAIPHSSPPFNVTSFGAQPIAAPSPDGTPEKSGNLYWEYAQIEIS